MKCILILKYFIKTIKCLKGSNRNVFEGTQGFLPQPGKALERPSSTRLEARFPYHGSGAMTGSPSPLAWRPDFPGAPREAHWPRRRTSWETAHWGRRWEQPRDSPVIERWGPSSPAVPALATDSLQLRHLGRRGTQMLNCNPQWVSPLSQPTTDIRALLSTAPVFQKVRVLRSIWGCPLGLGSAKTLDMLRVPFYWVIHRHF